MLVTIVFINDANIILNSPKKWKFKPELSGEQMNNNDIDNKRQNIYGCSPMGDDQAGKPTLAYGWFLPATTLSGCQMTLKGFWVLLSFQDDKSYTPEILDLENSGLEPPTI